MWRPLEGETTDKAVKMTDLIAWPLGHMGPDGACDYVIALEQ